MFFSHAITSSTWSVLSVNAAECVHGIDFILYTYTKHITCFVTRKQMGKFMYTVAIFPAYSLIYLAYTWFESHRLLNWRRLTSKDNQNTRTQQVYLIRSQSTQSASGQRSKSSQWHQEIQIVQSYFTHHISEYLRYSICFIKVIANFFSLLIWPSKSIK